MKSLSIVCFVAVFGVLGCGYEGETSTNDALTN